MKYIDEKKIRESLLNFTKDSVSKFLNNNPNLRFYSFAYDCNAEYAEVNLCFNTQEDFEKTLKHYQNGEYSKYYQLEDDIKELKYNTGDWEYQCFESTHVLSSEKLDDIFKQMPDDDYKSWKEFAENLMTLFCQCLIDFQNTEVYNKIPKTEDFMVFCIDHDEDVENALQRMENIK